MNLQVTFRDFPPSDSVRTHVENRAKKLVEHAERIIAIKVALGAPHHHHKHGNAFRVRIEIIAPGGDLVISPRDSAQGHTDLHAAVDDAFADAERRLRDRAGHRRSEAKSPASD